MRRLRLGALPEVKGVVERLPTRKLQEIALQRMYSLTTRAVKGLPLDARAHTGDLSDCRKLYFDEVGGRPSWRIVYRLLPDETEPTAIEVIPVGPRRDLEVYTWAAERLGRGEPEEDPPTEKG